MVKKIVLSVSGMHCSNCARTIQNALQDLTGVKAAVVDFAAKKATLEFDPAVCSEKQIVDAIKETGYVPAVTA